MCERRGSLCSGRWIFVAVNVDIVDDFNLVLTSASVSELSRLVTHTAVSSPKCNSEKRPLSNSVAFQTLFKWHRYCGILKIHIVRKINTGIRYEPVYRPALGTAYSLIIYLLTLTQYFRSLLCGFWWGIFVFLEELQPFVVQQRVIIQRPKWCNSSCILKAKVYFTLYAYARDSVQCTWCEFHHQNSTRILCNLRVQTTHGYKNTGVHVQYARNAWKHLQSSK